MKPSLLALCILVAFDGLSAQTTAWQPSRRHTQIPIWPGVPSGAQDAAPEIVTRDQIVKIRKVSRPTLTVYSPKGKNTGAAVVVLPGGGYQILAMDLEGTEACDWLTSKGMTCVLLKYRVPNTGPTWDQRCGCDRNTRSSMALEDAQRTIGVVRFHAAQWHIDPHKIGVLGFSAGGHLVALVSTHFDRVYPAVDSADKESCRPDFAVALYPGHLWIDYDKFELNPDIRITKDTPPTFLLQAENDNIDPVNHSLVYYKALKDAHVPVEMHLYPEGGHAFAFRPTKFPITRWPALLETLLHTIGMLPQ